MSLGERRRRLLVAGVLLALVGVAAAVVLSRDEPDGGSLPDFRNQKVIYEPAIGRAYSFKGLAAELLRPEDLGAGWYYGSDPAPKRPSRPDFSVRRLVKATRLNGGVWKAETCLLEQIRRWPTSQAAAADLAHLEALIDHPGHRRAVIAGVTVTELDTVAMRSAVFRRGNDVVNLNVCLHLATSDFSPAAADLVVAAAVRRSAA